MTPSAFGGSTNRPVVTRPMKVQPKVRNDYYGGANGYYQ